MRRASVLVIAALLLGLASGCSSDGSDPGNEVKQLSVFLTNDVTEAEKDGVEEWLKDRPDVESVTFESGEDSYETMLERLEEDPALQQRVRDTTRPEDLPDSFVVVMDSEKAFREARDGDFADEARNVPGVQDVVFVCDLREFPDGCRSPAPTASPN